MNLLQLPLLKGTSPSQSHWYFPPHPLLRTVIAHYTVNYPQCISSELTLIPDASGCLVFRLMENRTECTLWGPTTHTFIVNGAGAADCPLIFVEFLPCGAHQLLGVDLNELTDLRVPLSSVNAMLCNELLAASEQATDIQDLFSRFDSLFLSCLSHIHTTSTAANLLPLIHRESGIITVKAVAESANYSERQLNRIFKQEMGMSAKKFAKLCRINCILQEIERETLSLTDLAQQFGYFDQAHFSHEFKSVCGTTPTLYREKMSVFYKEPYKF